MRSKKLGGDLAEFGKTQHTMIFLPHYMWAENNKNSFSVKLERKKSHNIDEKRRFCINSKHLENRMWKPFCNIEKILQETFYPVCGKAGVLHYCRRGPLYFLQFQGSIWMAKRVLPKK